MVENDWKVFLLFEFAIRHELWHHKYEDWQFRLQAAYTFLKSNWMVINTDDDDCEWFPCVTPLSSSWQRCLFCVNALQDHPLSFRWLRCSNRFLFRQMMTYYSIIARWTNYYRLGAESVMRLSQLSYKRSFV